MVLQNLMELQLLENTYKSVRFLIPGIAIFLSPKSQKLQCYHGKYFHFEIFTNMNTPGECSWEGVYKIWTNCSYWKVLTIQSGLYAMTSQFFEVQNHVEFNFLVKLIFVNSRKRSALCHGPLCLSVWLSVCPYAVL